MPKADALSNRPRLGKPSIAAPLRLVDMGYATTKDSFIQIPRHTAALF
jgi:hypothetical protein